MDFIFDLNDKNWPVENKGRMPINQVIVTMGEYGFKAVTKGTGGLGKAILAGNSYQIQLPGIVEDANKFMVRFMMIKN